MGFSLGLKEGRGTRGGEEGSLEGPCAGYGGPAREINLYCVFFLKLNLLNYIFYIIQLIFRDIV